MTCKISVYFLRSKSIPLSYVFKASFPEWIALELTFELSTFVGKLLLMILEDLKQIN